VKISGDITMDTITNLENPKIKYYRSLTQKKYRDKEGKFLIEGLRFVLEALEDATARGKIEVLIAEENFLQGPKARDLMTRIDDLGVNLIMVSEKVLKSLAETENPQGIIGVLSYDEDTLETLKFADKAFLLIIDGVQDPGNLGTIIRTAHAAGVDGILLTKGTVDLYNAKVLRSTMGSIFKPKLIKGIETADIISYFKANQIPIAVADVNADLDYYNLDYTNSIALVVGNEANGPSSEILNEAQYKINIPMPGGTESLNVAIAAGILLYEGVRQKVKK
jgi:RNA methyltransferase, TrmH family